MFIDDVEHFLPLVQKFLTQSDFLKKLFERRFSNHCHSWSPSFPKPPFECEANNLSRWGLWRFFGRPWVFLVRFQRGGGLSRISAKITEKEVLKEFSSTPPLCSSLLRRDLFLSLGGWGGGGGKGTLGGDRRRRGKDSGPRLLLFPSSPHELFFILYLKFY